MALEQVKSDPLNNSIEIINKLKDTKWHDWQKRASNINGVEIHFNYNSTSNLFDDFKIKIK